MADISSLSGLRPVEQLNLANYKDVKESTFRLPAADVYTLQAPPSFPSAAFGETKNGDLSVQIDPKIVDGPHTGFQIRFIKVSAKVYNRDGEKASQLGDYMRSCGYTGTLNDAQEQANAAESTANLTYRAKVDWEARNSRTGFKVKGMRNFPKLADGTYQSWVEDPTEVQVDETTGKPKVDALGNQVHTRIRANLVIDRFLAAQ